jgi:hypothetical protein
MRNAQLPTDFSSVTEAPRIKVTPEGAAMLYMRYRFAARFCKGKDVLEVGCATGMGLGYLARHARTVVGETLRNRSCGKRNRTIAGASRWPGLTLTPSPSGTLPSTP